MDQEAVKKSIEALLPQASFNENKQFVEVVISKESWLTSAQLLKAKLGFDFLVSLSGVDYAGSMAVVCHLRSTSNNSQIVVKIHDSNKDNPSLDSVATVWAAAEFFEREVYDLLGIQFPNHPDLRRLFLEDDFVGHPLRKDYKDEINIIER
ncbi:MAG: NADH-quinone oxidoreductase subunit C [Breznakibacter sp.]|jgi:NADH/F420H2 dehydrogenase subunit C|nr:NADH-quinone oxidoreductase subunit C [Breznakibacter sp.]